VKDLTSFLKGADWVGVHFALNIFFATAILWLILMLAAGLDPIWAISSMIAASDPNVKQATRTFWGRIINALVGCVIGMVFLLLGGSSDWKLPIALAVTVLITVYVVRVPVMWRQAPITAALIIAAGLTHHTKLTSVEIGLRRVGEVMLGCVVGLVVSWLASKVWPLPEAASQHAATKG
jgi:uncharacterized membrane protein YccC